jgi:hypothetical protein
MNRCPCDTCPKIEGRVESGSDNQRQRQIVWTLKKASGNIATGPDVRMRALVRRADMLHRQGLGGGINSLLIPTAAKGRKRLELDRAKYQLRRVKPRKTGERGKVRELSVIACFLCHALALKEHVNPAWSAEMFLTWVITELADDASPVRKLAIANEEFQVFVNEPRRLRWWQNRVTELRKMSR